MTALASTRNSRVSLLAALVDNDDADSGGEYRFLVDGSHVKYVTIEPGVIHQSDQDSSEALPARLPEFPPGDWNEATIGLSDAGQTAFTGLRRASLPGIGNVWHGASFNHLDLQPVERVRQTLHRVTHPAFARPVLAKFAQFPWEIPYFAAETTSYEWIHGRGIGPEFLGHIHEEGRVIGFLLEEIPGARTAEPGDLAACQRSLDRLHELGIKHCDINKHNFLIRGDHQEACIIDFETAQKCADREQLEAEYEQLLQSLEDMSGRGGAGMASDSSSD